MLNGFLALGQLIHGQSANKAIACSARCFNAAVGNERQIVLDYIQRLYMVLAEREAIMNTATVNISFQESLLADIDKIARVESRSRSELLREAVRLYIDRKRRWDRIFAYGKAVVTRENLTETDVASEIQAYRQQKARNR